MFGDFCIMRFTWISGLKDRIEGLEKSNTEKDSLINHYKEQTLTAPASQKYKPATTKILLNTLYKVQEISEAMTLELPRKYNIEIFGSYKLPSSSRQKNEMHIVDNHSMGNFVMLSDIPTYLYFKYTGNAVDHIIAKGFTAKNI